MKFKNKKFHIFCILFLQILFIKTVLNSKLITEKNKGVSLSLSTVANDWGNGNIFYLDRHDVTCPKNQALQGFRLTRPNHNSLSYAYACKNSQAISDRGYEESTPINDTDKNVDHSVHYLDRHTVACRENHVLQRFRLVRDKKMNNKIQYTYRCVEADCTDTKTVETPETDAGKYETIFLDRQNIILQENQVLMGFKLNTRYESSGWIFKSTKAFFKYRITFCTLKERSAATTAPPLPLGALQTSANDFGNGSIFYLDRHDVKCQEGNLLTGFILKRPTPNEINYIYTCKNSPAIKQNISYDSRTAENLTDPNEYRSINYLDRHTILCNEGYALQRFKLERTPNLGKKIFYSYKCVQVACDDKKIITTAETSAGDLTNIYLDRQNISLDSERVLMGFKLNSRYQGSSVFFTYTITSCKLIQNSTNTPKNPNLNPTPPPPVILKNGEVCFNSSVDKGEKPCEVGLSCRYENPNAVVLPTTSKKCLPPFVPPPMIPIEKPRILGEICYQSTPDFNGKQKPCEVGLLCKFENDKVTNHPPGTPMKCMKPGIPLPLPVLTPKEKAKNFCSTNCQINNNAPLKKCYDGKLQPCRRCILKPTVNDNEKADLCQAICNSILPNQLCDFYGYLNNKKKNINPSILTKYGIEIAKKR